jgi:hypothetical protein
MLIFLARTSKVERRKHYGRERKVKDQRCGKGRDKKQNTALQHLWKQDRYYFVRFPQWEEKNETRML